MEAISKGICKWTGQLITQQTGTFLSYSLNVTREAEGPSSPILFALPPLLAPSTLPPFSRYKSLLETFADRVASKTNGPIAAWRLGRSNSWRSLYHNENGTQYPGTWALANTSTACLMTHGEACGVSSGLAVLVFQKLHSPPPLRVKSSCFSSKMGGGTDGHNSDWDTNFQLDFYNGTCKSSPATP